MAVLKLPGWMQPLMRRRHKMPVPDDPAGFGAELGLEMSLASQTVAAARKLQRAAEASQGLDLGAAGGDERPR